MNQDGITTDQTENGKHLKPNAKKGTHAVYIASLNLWIMVEKSLTDKQIEKRVSRFITNYLNDRSKIHASH